MFYCSIDIETTGLDQKKCDIVQFAAVLDNLSDPQPLDKLPKFQTYLTKRRFNGEPFALSMHPQIFRKIADAQQKRIEENEFGERFMGIRDLPTALENFFSMNGVPQDQRSGKYKITVAGKNAGMFDLPFLKRKVKDWGNIVFLHRVMDPAILYYQPGDKTLPDSKLCMERAGIKDEVAHTALEDALMVVRLIRHKLLA